jgi:SAM-dependent methyltransferase
VHGGDTPSAWVRRFAPLIDPAGTVLDLACGLGRHARLFAAAGMRVVAVDRDPSAGAALAAVAGVDFIGADLEGAPWPLPGRTFGGIVVTNYLHRPLFATLAAALAPGGVLIYETFAAGNERYGKPSNPAFLLRPRELFDAFAPRLHVLAYEDGVVDAPRPARIQRIAAVHLPARPQAADAADAAGASFDARSMRLP